MKRAKVKTADKADLSPDTSNDGNLRNPIIASPSGNVRYANALASATSEKPMKIV